MLVAGIIYGGLAIGLLVGNTGVVGQLASAVGISVGVQQSDVSRLAQQLDEKEIELQGRELAVVERDRSLEQTIVTQNRRLVLFVLSFVLILMVLVGVNFYYDWQFRSRPQPPLRRPDDPA